MMTPEERAKWEKMGVVFKPYAETMKEPTKKETNMLMDALRGGYDAVRSWMPDTTGETLAKSFKKVGRGGIYRK